MDVYVIYPVLCVDIYVISLFVLMESKKQKNSIFPLFAECRDHGTRQSWEAETQFSSFAECQSHGTRQRFFFKRKKLFAECKSMALGKEFFLKKKKNSLPSAAEVALGKEAVRVDVGFFFAEC